MGDPFGRRRRRRFIVSKWGRIGRYTCSLLGKGGEGESLTVVNEERNVWVGDDVGGLARGRVGGHDDDGRVGVGRGGQVGVVHEGHVGHVVGACGQVKLFVKLSWSAPSLDSLNDGCDWGSYKSGIFEALNHLGGQSARPALVRVSLGRLVVERDLVHGVVRLSLSIEPFSNTKCAVEEAQSFLPACDQPMFQGQEANKALELL